jgi:FlaA1/EpsC-like NDP-sugar epimerase
VIPVNRHRIWQLVADACLIALAWWLSFELRFDQGRPGLLRQALPADAADRRRDPAGRLRPLPLLRPLVALTSRCATCGPALRGVTAAVVASSLTVYFFSPVAPVRLPRSVAIMDWLLLLAFVAGSRLLARSVIERPGTG